jgi:glycosyltransferase involved in cell wall biosynthesis
MNAATLSIVIPTFNRNDKLANLLRSYQSFLPENARVLLIDDCSPTPIADTLQAEGLIPDSRVTIIRNTANVGLAANIIECFKQCSTEWMWLMSDDDQVSRSSYTQITDVLPTVPDDCIFVNFSSSLYSREQAYYTTGIAELLNQLDSVNAFRNLLFMSTGCYRVGAFRNSIRFGYQYAYSLAPHLAMLFTSIAGRKAYFSPANIIGQGYPENGWSAVNFQMIKGALLELPLPWTDQLFTHFATILSNDYNDDETYFKRILLGCALNPGRYEVFLFKTILARNPYRKLTLRQRAKRLFFLFVIQHPRFVFLYKVLRKDIPAAGSSSKDILYRHNRI